MGICGPNKKQLAEILRKIGDLIEESNNKTVSIDLTIIFVEEEKSK